MAALLQNFSDFSIILLTVVQTSILTTHIITTLPLHLEIMMSKEGEICYEKNEVIRRSVANIFGFSGK